MSSPSVLEDFIQYSEQLRDSLETQPGVIGLVLVGSTAALERVDEWSDHDFFVITKDGSAEALRQDLTWLPNYAEIAMSPRETDHGLKVVYQNSKVLEFAVFDDKELELASVNSYAVALDKTNITERMLAIQGRSAPKPFMQQREFELFLALLLIGVGRARRGETLMAGQFVRSYCLSHVLGFIRAWQSPLAGTESKEDNLSRHRRFELQYPELAVELEGLQQLPVEASGRGLLDLVLRLGAGQLTDVDAANARIVQDRFGWS
ncbi:MAG: hypothetical protein ACKOUD_01740 [Rhodoluna sp.]